MAADQPDKTPPESPESNTTEQKYTVRGYLGTPSSPGWVLITELMPGRKPAGQVIPLADELEGAVGYQAYVKSYASSTLPDWENYVRPMPDWDALPVSIKQAWIAVAHAYDDRYAR